MVSYYFLLLLEQIRNPIVAAFGETTDKNIAYQYFRL